MNSIKKGPRTAANGHTGELENRFNLTLQGQRHQGLARILEACLRAIDNRRFAFAGQLVALALSELNRFENASGSAVADVA